MGNPLPPRASQLLGIVPLAVRDLPASLSLIAALPVRVEKKLSSETVTFATTLIGPAGHAGPTERVSKPASDFTTGSGAAYNLPLRATTPGEYRLRIETVLGNRKPVVRELSFLVMR